MLEGSFNFRVHVTWILMCHFSGFNRCKGRVYGCRYLLVKEITDVHMCWMGGDPAVRGRVGVNGVTARSEEGAEQWRDRYKSAERVERYTHIHCSASCLNSVGNLLTEELGLTEGP